MKQQRTASLAKRQIPQFIQNHRVDPLQGVGNTTRFMVWPKPATICCGAGPHLCVMPKPATCRSTTIQSKTPSGQSPSEKRIGYSQEANVPGNGLPRFKVCWPRRKSTGWSQQPGSNLPWKNSPPARTPASTNCCLSSTDQIWLSLKMWGCRTLTVLFVARFRWLVVGFSTISGGNVERAEAIFVTSLSQEKAPSSLDGACIGGGTRN